MERLALENPRSLEFVEFIDPSSWDGRGTIGSDIRLGQTRDGYNGIHPLTPRAMIHGSMVTNGAKVIPSLDEVVAWLEASLLDPSEGETEEPSHVRQQKGPDEPQAAVEKEVEEEKIEEYEPQRDAMITTVQLRMLCQT